MCTARGAETCLWLDAVKSFWWICMCSLLGPCCFHYKDPFFASKVKRKTEERRTRSEGFLSPHVDTWIAFASTGGTKDLWLRPHSRRAAAEGHGRNRHYPGLPSVSQPSPAQPSQPILCDPGPSTLLLFTALPRVWLLCTPTSAGCTS